MFENKKLIISGSIFIGILILSLIFFAVNHWGHSKRILYFPEKQSGKLISEERYIKRGRNFQITLTNFVSELLLGPVTPGCSRIFPAGTKLIFLSEHKKNVKIFFSYGIMQNENDSSFSMEKLLQSVVNNIVFNYKNIQDIEFYIEDYKIPIQKTTDEGQLVDMYLIHFDETLLK